MKEKRPFTQLMLIPLVVGLLIFALDTSVGFTTYINNQQSCSNHIINKTPGRGLRYEPWSSAELEKIQHVCHHVGLEGTAVLLPFNQRLVAHWVGESEAKCIELAEVQPNYFGCPDESKLN